jgi:hypothetical protein
MKKEIFCRGARAAAASCGTLEKWLEIGLSPRSSSHLDGDLVFSQGRSFFMPRSA